MARDFSFKEARELAGFYKKLLKQLSDATHYPKTKLADVRTQFNSLKSMGYFETLANHELDGIVYKEKEGYFNKLLLYIDSYLKGIKIAETCASLFRDNHVDLNIRIDKLSSANNPISWVFTNKKGKEKAIEQYNYLSAFSQSPFVDNATNVLEELSGLSQTNIDEIKYRYFNERHSFYEVVKTAEPNAFVNNNTLIERLKNLIKKNDSLINDIDIVQKGVEAGKKDIEDAVGRLVARELINLLRAIPVDEVNRDRKGIRVKSLRDAGYTNMADLYAASVYNLSSVYGISQDVAYTLKRIANDYAIKAQKGIKIKLSTDDKNMLANNVVKAVYVLRQINKFVEIINEQNKIYSSKINDSINTLKHIGNGSIWPFLSDAEKNNYITLYSYLKDTLYGDYGKTIANTVADYKASKHSFSGDAWEDFAKNSIQFYNIIEEVCPGVLGTDDSIYGLPEDLAREIQDECIFPDGLLCTLRRYQEWGVKYILHQEKVLLGDEMGLGKTIQAIATMVSLKNTGATHFVVVCPASVLTNWCREITKHSRLRVIKVHGYGKIYAFRAWLKNGGVAVTTYESTGVFKFDNSFRFSQLVVDEAHYVKNPNATRSKRVRALCEYTERILFMTGTALENRVDEMIELISVLRLDIANRISRIAFMSTAPQFRQEIAPVYYRRKREDVLTELPDLIESEEWCSLSPEEEYAYEAAILEKNHMEARRVSWNIDNIHNSCKAKRLLEIIEDAKNDGRKILVFSFFLDTIRKIHDLLGDGVCLNPINGSINPNRRQEIIDEFDAAPSGTVLCAQIQSGGTGLNIQAASVVVICEPQLKPSIENQAISRAYRMGQSRNVQVFRLLCENTIDERMMDLLKEKQAIFDAFADKSVAADNTVEIDDKSFGDLINAEIERIKAKNGGANPRPYQPGDMSDDSEDGELGETFDSTELKELPQHVKTEPIPTIKYDSSISYVDELKMSYKNLVAHLLAKYGPAKGDYFLTETCRSKNNSISRGKEGLFCHHIDEDKAILLSNPDFAVRNPFEYQKANRLVYCDILEHLILHIKIAEEAKSEAANENELVGIGGAATFICRQINDCYSGRYLTQSFMVKIKEQIQDKFNDYIIILQRLYDLIKGNDTYSIMFSKDDICSGFDGEIVQKVYNLIK